MLQYAGRHEWRKLPKELGHDWETVQPGFEKRHLVFNEQGWSAPGEYTRCFAFTAFERDMQTIDQLLDMMRGKVLVDLNDALL